MTTAARDAHEHAVFGGRRLVAGTGNQPVAGTSDGLDPRAIRAGAQHTAQRADGLANTPRIDAVGRQAPHRRPQRIPTDDPTHVDRQFDQQREVQRWASHWHASDVQDVRVPVDGDVAHCQPGLLLGRRLAAQRRSHPCSENRGGQRRRDEVVRTGVQRGDLELVVWVVIDAGHDDDPPAAMVPDRSRHTRTRSKSCGPPYSRMTTSGDSADRSLNRLLRKSSDVTWNIDD